MTHHLSDYYLPHKRCFVELDANSKDASLPTCTYYAISTVRLLSPGV
jgi:hypothetical protein